MISFEQAAAILWLSDEFRINITPLFSEVESDFHLETLAKRFISGVY